MGERWTEETAEAVARVLRDADTQGWLTGPDGILAPYYQAIAAAVLGHLADAGLLLPQPLLTGGVVSGRGYDLPSGCDGAFPGAWRQLIWGRHE